MRLLIVEDEKIAAKHLLQMLKKVHFEYEEVIVIRSVSELVAWLSKNKEPDLIFLDIHLNDGNSLQVFDILKVSAPVIFVTAYDKYVIDSFKANSINYILKPIDENVLRESIAKFFKIKDYYGKSSTTGSGSGMLICQGENFGKKRHCKYFYPGQRHRIFLFGNEDLVCC